MGRREVTTVICHLSHTKTAQPGAIVTHKKRVSGCLQVTRLEYKAGFSAPERVAGVGRASCTLCGALKATRQGNFNLYILCRIHISLDVSIELSANKA